MIRKRCMERGSAGCAVLLAVISMSLIVRSAIATEFPAYLGQWGSYGTGPGQFFTPVAAAEGPDGSVYVVDSNLKRVQKFTIDGVYSTQWSVHLEGARSHPTGIAVSSSGDVYVSDVEQSQVQKYSGDGVLLAKWGTFGTGPGQFWGPYSIAIDRDDYVYVVEARNHRVQKFTRNGDFVAMWGSYGHDLGQFDHPQGIAASPFGMVYVLDVADLSGRGRVQRFSTDGTYLGTRHLDPGYWVRIALDRGGIAYLVDNRGSRVGRYTHTGPLLYWGSSGRGISEFLNPIGISTSHLLNTNMRVYVCDTNNSRLQVFGEGPTPTRSTSWGRIKVLFR